MVFDAFWRRGELALMFGEEGSGKSFVAVQIAEALAGGRDIPTFRMDSEPDRVLYVDLALSDEQFARRYAWRGYRDKTTPYNFSSRFYRDRPPSDDELIPWLKEQIESEKIKYVIIDDLSAVMKTCDGTRDTLGAMRELRRLRDKFGISILVLMPSSTPGRDGIAREADLGRQRALCGVADSVFAIGRHEKQREWRYLMQTRSRNAPIRWTARNAWWATLGESINRLKGLNFEDRTTAEEKELIGKIYSAKSSGKTFREIGLELGISKSRASRLYQRWGTAASGWKPRGDTSVNERGDEPAAAAQPIARVRENDPDDDIRYAKAEDACGIRSEEDDIIDSIGGLSGPGYRGKVAEEIDELETNDELDGPDDELENTPAPPVSVEHIGEPANGSPPTAASSADTSRALPVGFPPMEAVRDHNGRTRYIEQRFPDGKPKVWYQYVGKDLRKYVDNGWGVLGSAVDIERVIADMR